MSQLFVAALVLLASHFGISSTPLRAFLIARIGERPYLILYSLIAFTAIGWLVHAWAQAPYIELWPHGPGLAGIPFIVMPFALVLLVSGLSTPNPTALGAPDVLSRSDSVRGIFRVTRHPFMWGVVLWAGAHIVANGDLASLVFFAGLGLLALLGQPAARRDRKRPPALRLRRDRLAPDRDGADRLRHPAGGAPLAVRRRAAQCSVTRNPSAASITLAAPLAASERGR
jgi:uncharacterized membrane protein